MPYSEILSHEHDLEKFFIFITNVYFLVYCATRGGFVAQSLAQALRGHTDLMYKSTSAQQARIILQLVLTRVVFLKN